MKKYGKKGLTAALVLALALAVVFASAALGERDGAPDSGFFAQTDAYIAAARGTAVDAILTYFDVSSRGLERPVACELRGCDGAVGASIEKFSAYDSGNGVPAYSLGVRFSFGESGIHRANELVLIYSEDSEAYVIGDWCFDVADETETLAVDSYSTVYATSKTDALPYRYIFDDGVSDGDEVYLEYCERSTPALDIENGEISGEVELPESRYALRLIRPRIVVERGGETFYAYPVAACQCGYLDFDEDDFNASRLMALGE